MLLLSGPPGSGKTSYVLDRVRTSARLGANATRLLTPTATMAQHLRNQVAREGLVLRSSTIQTLWQFIEGLIEDAPEASPAILALLVRDGLRKTVTPAFTEAASFPGFERALASLVDELSSAGMCSEDRMEGEYGAAIQAVFAHVETRLRGLGLASRSDRLKRAAQRIEQQGVPGIESLLFDGFFAFTGVELELIRALAGKVDVTVTLPEWAGSRRSLLALEEMGFEPKQVGRQRAVPRPVYFAAPSVDQEAEEVARRILVEAAAGRPFREIGIIIRGYAPCAPVLRQALSRFGIPARFYFRQPVDRHPAVLRIIRLVDAALGGWEHEDALGALRMAPATEELDRFEYEVLERIPGAGLESLGRMSEVLRALESWPMDVLPAREWVTRLKNLADFFPAPRIMDGVSHDQAGLWRNSTAALAEYEEAVQAAGDALAGAEPLRLAGFWEEAKAALASTALREVDGRRNVVHVIDVYEARQWELPVVFVCGLVEKQFPKYHAEDPLLPDKVRRRLGLRTSEERNEEEAFLFELATSRATEVLTLSYPEYNSIGDENLRSFLLDRFLEPGVRAERCQPVRPRASRRPPEPRPVAIADPQLLDALGSKHRTLSASAIERFLQCPYAFFADRTLKLQLPPVAPRERLDAALQGEIVHAVLAEAQRAPLTLELLFEEIFEEKCRAARVPKGYRTEMIRLEMLRNLREYIGSAGPPAAHKTITELEFRMELAEGLELRGRIDRLDVHAGRQVMLIDYKYSSGARLGEIVRANEEVDKVQAGLYLLAARKALGYEPLGMLYCALKGKVEWKGWHVALRDFERLGESCLGEDLEAMVKRATDASLEVARRLRGGCVEPVPANKDVCRWCDYRDICRFETQKLATGAGGGSR